MEEFVPKRMKLEGTPVLQHFYIGSMESKLCNYNVKRLRNIYIYIGCVYDILTKGSINFNNLMLQSNDIWNNITRAYNLMIKYNGTPLHHTVNFNNIVSNTPYLANIEVNMSYYNFTGTIYCIVSKYNVKDSFNVKVDYEEKISNSISYGTTTFNFYITELYSYTSYNHFIKDYTYVLYSELSKNLMRYYI